MEIKQGWLEADKADLIDQHHARDAVLPPLQLPSADEVQSSDWISSLKVREQYRVHNERINPTPAT